MRNLLPTVKSPNLPFATREYSQQQTQIVTDTLRLYFNRIETAISGILSIDGGRYIAPPYAQATDNTTQTTTANTATIVKFSALTGSGFKVATNRVTVDYPGVYNVQFSIQFSNTDTQAQDGLVWLRKNGTNIPNTASIYDVGSSHGGTPGHTIAVANFFIEFAAGDFLELVWATTSALVTIQASPAITTPYIRPAVPSSVITLSFVSNPAT